MKNIFSSIDWKKTGLFAAGVAFGTAGIKVLSSDDAKKVYTNCTAAVLRAKDCVMKTATTIHLCRSCSDQRGQSSRSRCKSRRVSG